MGERGRQGDAPGIIPGGREEGNMGERGRQGDAPGIIPGGREEGNMGERGRQGAAPGISQVKALLHYALFHSRFLKKNSHVFPHK